MKVLRGGPAPLTLEALGRWAGTGAQRLTEPLPLLINIPCRRVLMGLRLALQHLEAGLAALNVAVVEFTAAAEHLAPKKRTRLLSTIKNLKAEQVATRHVLQRVHAVRNRRSRVAAEDNLDDDEFYGIEEIFAEAQNLRGAGGTPRESTGEAPPSWDDAVKRMEEREL